jgi:hypothetical protein
MKAIVCIYLFMLSIAGLQAQVFTMHGSCDFESDCPYLRTLSDTGIWEIGSPTKKTIRPSYSPPNCVVTDAGHPVGVNVNEYIQFDIPARNEGDQTPTYLAISFNYQNDLSLNRDKCNISMAFDSSDYHNLVYLDMLYDQEDFSDMWYGINDYVTFDADTAVTGTSGGWRAGSIEVIFYMTVEPAGDGEVEVDTVHLRFTLETDSIDDNGGGFAIDNFDYRFVFWGEVDQINAGNKLHVYPNPVENTVTLSCDQFKGSMQDVMIYSVSGQTANYIQIAYFDQSGTATLDLQHLQPGVYICSAGYPDNLFRGIVVKQ